MGMLMHREADMDNGDLLTWGSDESRRDHDANDDILLPECVGDGDDDPCGCLYCLLKDAIREARSLADDVFLVGDYGEYSDRFKE